MKHSNRVIRLADAIDVLGQLDAQWLNVAEKILSFRRPGRFGSGYVDAVLDTIALESIRRGVSTRDAEIKKTIRVNPSFLEAMRRYAALTTRIYYVMEFPNPKPTLWTKVTEEMLFMFVLPQDKKRLNGVFATRDGEINPCRIRVPHA